MKERGSDYDKEHQLEVGIIGAYCLRFCKHCVVQRSKKIDFGSADSGRRTGDQNLKVLSRVS
jgi:hypothetical protein